MSYNFGLNNDPNATVAPGNWAGLLPDSLKLSSVLGKAGAPLPYFPPTSTLPNSGTLLSDAWQPKNLSNFSTGGFNLDAGQGASLDSILGKGANPDVPGMALTDKIKAGVGLFNAGMDAINSFKTNKLAKQQFAFQKDAWNKEYAAQKNLTNAQLADRQAVRYREHPELNMSVADYMAKYGVQ